MAEPTGVGIVSVKNSSHPGALAPIALKAARKKYIVQNDELPTYKAYTNIRFGYPDGGAYNLKNAYNAGDPGYEGIIITLNDHNGSGGTKAYIFTTAGTTGALNGSSQVIVNINSFNNRLQGIINELKTAIEGVTEFKKFKPTWIEEPLRWEDDRRTLRLLSKQTDIPISGGESELTTYGCRSIIEEDAIQILQFDCTMFGGFTNGKKLSALCELNHLDIAPHHDCYIHAPLVASSPSGRIVESFDDERDPLQAELFENSHKMSNGWIHLNENPGLGLEISETALKKFGKLVYKNK